MPGESFNSSRPRWTDTAIRYARHFGWRIVPLHSNPDLAAEASDNPVVLRLGYLPHVGIPEGASSDPERIAEWQGYPSAPAAVLTGFDSDLVALEIPTPLPSDAHAAVGPLVDGLPATKQVLSQGSAIYFFSIPDTVASLPTFRENDGLRFYGEGSLVRIPVRPDKPSEPVWWSFDSTEELSSLPESVAQYFGLEYDGASVDSDSERSEASTSPSTEADAAQDTAPSGDGASGHGASGDGASGDGALGPTVPGAELPTSIDPVNRENGSDSTRAADTSSDSGTSSDSAASPEPDRAGETDAPDTSPSGSPSGSSSNGTSGATPYSGGRRTEEEMGGDRARITGTPRESGSRKEPPGTSAGRLPFRSGDDLLEPERPEQPWPLPWIGPGALTLLTGYPKKSGKSTFISNLAAHLAAGKSFLGKSVEPEPVVLLSDLPARRFRSLLYQIGVNRAALSRLHVLHPRDVADNSWQYVVSHAYEQAMQVGARLVILDSLDQFVAVKSGVDVCNADQLIHSLTAESPAECATIAVKAIQPEMTSMTVTSVDQTVSVNLGLLGTSADVIAHLQDRSTDRRPTLRRLLFSSRLDATPTTTYCELVRGCYEEVRPTEIEGGSGRVSRLFPKHGQDQDSRIDLPPVGKERDAAS